MTKIYFQENKFRVLTGLSIVEKRLCNKTEYPARTSIDAYTYYPWIDPDIICRSSSTSEELPRLHKFKQVLLKSDLTTAFNERRNIELNLADNFQYLAKLVSRHDPAAQTVKAFSEDLRWRVIFHEYLQDSSIEETVYDTRKRYSEHGDVKSRARGHIFVRYGYTVFQLTGKEVSIPNTTKYRSIILLGFMFTDDFPECSIIVFNRWVLCKNRLIKCFRAVFRGLFSFIKSSNRVAYILGLTPDPEISNKKIKWLTGNLIVIGVERYLTIFHPSKLPTTDTCKRLVMASWFVGAFMTIAYPGSITVLKRFELGEGQYTLHCSSNSVELTKVLRITSLIIQYIIPAVSLTVMSVRVLKFLHRRRQQAHPLQVNSTFNASMRSTLWYYKDSYMFASLTLAFVFPYAAPILYAIVLAFIPGESSFSEYYVVRIVALFMCYSNTIINPIIYLYCMRDMRKRVREILSRVCACCVTMETTPPVVEIEITNLPHQRLEVRPPCVGVFTPPPSG
ncbi:predicted protein [Nematostella vectensis]|uniref:G-protein coupled receptors family 1 profile domain-containing protein n=1 Tax=Nematostella vectensis TaxID=45351 RepID=A7S0I2_NEMVE|nr:predicted protein [Nematostella vectensis]|eukprot:XP_001634747.1 predicted protein [Nematostella vectensis]